MSLVTVNFLISSKLLSVFYAIGQPLAANNWEGKGKQNGRTRMKIEVNSIL
jgi:hypothetical protein